MNLYAVRHAVAYRRDANIWPDDAERPLTPKGEEWFRYAAKGILQLAPEVEVVLSSPFVRAWRTAKILEQAGWPAPVFCEELKPGQPPHKVLSVLARYEGLGAAAIVGHRPGLHELISYLLTGEMIGEDCGARVQIRKGGAAFLSFDATCEAGAGSLEWLLTPEALRAVEGAAESKRKSSLIDG